MMPTTRAGRLACRPWRAAPCCALALLATTPAHAADDVPWGEWRGPVALSVSLASGNTDARTAALSAELARRTEFDKTIVSGLANYGKAAGSTTANRWLVNGQYQHDLDETLFGVVKLGLQRDAVQQLALRTAASLGLGAHLVRNDRHEFDVSAGVGYSSDRYRVERTVDGRTGSRFGRRELVFGEESSHRLNDTVSFRQRIEFFPALSGRDGQRANASADLAVAMNRSLSLTVGLTIQYNGRPPVGLRRTDTLFLTGIALKVGD